jgi:hypothetical protein
MMTESARFTKRAKRAPPILHKHERSVDELFQPFLLKNPHEYCAYMDLLYA